MKPKTEELLYFLLWSCESLARPTWRNLTQSFESWSYHNGLHRQLARLRASQFLESQHHGKAFLCRLTERGRLHALGGRDPERCWSRTWDGRWRVVLFDVPTGENPQRNRLRRCLRACGFGCLQNSVWITPHPLDHERHTLAGDGAAVERLILLEAKPCGGETNEEIVAGAWDFARVNSAYAHYLEVLENRPRQLPRNPAEAKSLRAWARKERAAWLEAITIDPLLPAPLLPERYSGRAAWRARKEALHSLAAGMAAFRAS